MLHTEKRSLIPWTLKVCAAVLSLFGMSVIPMGAQSVLSGTVVTASDGQPIVGAYVLVKVPLWEPLRKLTVPSGLKHPPEPFWKSLRWAMSHVR